jgi:small-conductance mechanosensitive channel
MSLHLTQEWAADWPLPVFAVLVLALLFGLGFVLPPEHRGRLRAGIFFAGAYLVALFAVSALAPHPTAAGAGAGAAHEAGVPASLRTLRVLYHLLFCFAAVITAGFLVFDLALRRRQIPRILRDLMQGIGYLIAALMVFARGDMDVTKIFTASVLTTAVIGLALQETLGNVLAGLALQIERDFEVGDWIRVDDKITGRIQEVRWRATSLVTKDGDLILVPNGAVARAVLTNFSRPSAAHRQWIHLRVAFRHPPGQVREVVLEALRGAGEVRRDPPPDCLLSEFKDDAATYAVRYWIDDFQRDLVIDSDVRSLVWYALHRAGMEIPFPSRNVHVTEMNEDRARRKLDEDHARRLDALSKVDVFRALDAEKIDRLARRLRLVMFGPGEVILRQGDPGDSLYVVRSGRVLVRVGASDAGGGKQREITMLGAGQFFGEMSLMTGEARTATIVAQGDVECYVLAKDALQELLRDHPELAASISEILARRRAALGPDQPSERVPAAQERQQLLGRIAAFFGIKAR